MNDADRLNKIQEKINNIKNAADQQCFDINRPEEVKVQIRANKSVSRGMFRPDPFIPGGYIAHPSTIRAMRKDIFVLGDEEDDLEILHTCTSCKSVIDLHYWSICPYCELEVPNHIQK